MYSVLHSFGFFLVLFTGDSYFSKVWCLDLNLSLTKLLIKYILGAYLPWRIAVFLPGILAIPTFVLIMFLHESPEWLLKKGRIEEYKKSVEFFQIDKVWTGRVKNKKISHCSFIFLRESLTTIKIFLRDGRLRKTRKMTTFQCVKVSSIISAASRSHLWSRTDLFGGVCFFSQLCSLSSDGAASRFYLFTQQKSSPNQDRLFPPPTLHG